MSRIMGTLTVVVLLCVSTGIHAQDKNESAKKKTTVSFANDVFPIIEHHCLPCHAEENFNPSELSLDNYDLLIAGGKNGSPIVPGKSAESIMIQKFGENPPFDDRMPLNTKKKIAAGQAVWLSDEEIRTIATWIDQGAKDN